MKLRTISLLVSCAVVFAACGDATETSSPGTTTWPAASRGWLEGEDLDWSGDGRGGALAAHGYAEGDADGSSRDATSVDDSAGTIELPHPVDPPIDDSPLRAGSIDDGDDVGAYLEHRRLVAEAGVVVRPLDVSDSTVFTVVGDNGLPVLDALVEFWDPTVDRVAGSPEVILRTTADGSVRYSPGAMADGRADLLAVVRVGDLTAEAPFTAGEPAVRIDVATPGGVDGSVPLDVHFVLDATGSMGDEIARLRENMTAIARQIDALPSAPDVRFGMTVYRDEGDVFVTRTFDLTDDLDSFLEALAEVNAAGGGDYPEALDEALADALTKPEWRRDGAVELLFLIADAPPQVNRQVAQPSTASAVMAAEAGVKIFPVAASGTDDQAEYVMRELAFVTGGRFVFLSYGTEGTATGDRSDIAAEDYDELSLDQLVVRLVEDELSSLTGETTAPVTSTTLPITTTTYEQ